MNLSTRMTAVAPRSRSRRLLPALLLLLHLRERTAMFKRILAWSLGAAVVCAWQQAPGAAQEKAPGAPAVRTSKLDLTPQSFAQLHALVRPHESEWRHLKVEWLTDVVAARKKAAAEDKPIVICYTGGAGYNEPLGVC
jgi:hypothetical protein